MKRIINKLIKQGTFVEFTLHIKKGSFEDTIIYYVPDTEIKHLISAFPEYGRIGEKMIKVKGHSVLAPYYLTKGFFTKDKSKLMPIKINFILP